MLLQDLFEASLPLVKNQMSKFRGSYGAFIITMNPADFLKLTTTGDDYERIMNRPFPWSKEEYENIFTNDKDFGRYEMPFLNVQFPSGRIFGHEGRHRSAMIMRQGGKSVPVVIYPYEDYTYVAHLSYIDYAADPDEEYPEPTEWESEAYKSRVDARAALDAKKASLNPDDCYIRKERIETNYGGVLKGAPERSEGWDRAAWKVSDFPDHLIGQYDDSIVVSNFRVGLVKGYHHHTR